MNHEKFVERSVRSIVNQTFKNFEIIYLDNNSTDNTFEIADKIFRESGLPYRSFRRTENYGVGANVNFLWELAQTEYIATLSGDDFWDLANLEEKMDYYTKHPEYGMIYSGGYKYFYNTCETVLMDSSACKSGWIFKDLLKGNFINGIGIIVKKDALNNVGYFDENSLVEDWDMWLRIAEKYPIGFFEKPLVYYGQQTGNNISANTAYMDKGAEYIFKKYSGYKEIGIARKSYYLYRVYEKASVPTYQNFKYIISHFQFNLTWFKQLLKFFIRLISRKRKYTYGGS